jgi:hypothetical protein
MSDDYAKSKCSVPEVIEAVLRYYLQEGRGVTIPEIAQLEARESDEVAAVFGAELSELKRLGLEPVDDTMLPSDSVWEPTKQLLARIALRHLDLQGWSSRRVRKLITG